jgi:hypothetical protein
MPEEPSRNTPDLDITAAGTHRYDVVITDRSGRETSHTVDVPTGLLQRLGLSDAQEPLLVRASMKYLLEREPPSSILREFSLDVIARYFPDYPTDIKGMI